MPFHQGPITRPPAEVVLGYRDVESATLGHLTDFGFPRGLQPLIPVAERFAGSAVTVKIPHLDSTAVQCALDEIQPGDVLVIDQSGDGQRSSFGGGLAAVAKNRGAVAVLSNGSTNDVAEIEELGLPVFSKGRTALTTRVLGLEGEINVPVSIGGVVVCPGDVVFGDGGGVAVVPREQAEHRLDQLRAKEESFRQRNPVGKAVAGESLADLSGAREMFRRTQGVAR